MVNSLELITCLTSTLAMAKMLLTAWEHRCQFTFQVSTIMTTSEISVQAMPKENLITFRLALNLGSQSLVSGRLIGIKVTKCQLNIIFSKAKMIHLSTP